MNPHELETWEEDTALTRLRHRHIEERGKLGVRACRFTEGGYCTLFREGMRLKGRGGADDLIAAACAEIYEDEFGHMLEGIAGLDREDWTAARFQADGGTSDRPTPAPHKDAQRRILLPATGRTGEGDLRWRYRTRTVRFRVRRSPAVGSCRLASSCAASLPPRPRFSPARREVVRTYWDWPGRTIETDLYWLELQCFKEFKGSGVGEKDNMGVIMGPLAEVQEAIPKMDRGISRHRILHLLEELREEFSHLCAFADAYDAIRPEGTQPLRPASLRRLEGGPGTDRTALLRYRSTWRVRRVRLQIHRGRLLHAVPRGHAPERPATGPMPDRTRRSPPRASWSTKTSSDTCSKGSPGSTTWDSTPPTGKSLRGSLPTCSKRASICATDSSPTRFRGNASRRSAAEKIEPEPFDFEAAEKRLARQGAT